MFLNAYFKYLPQLLEHRFRRGYRNLRFMRSVYRQRTISAMCEMIAPKDPKTFTIVGLGDYSKTNFRNSPIKRQCAGPWVEITKRLQAQRNVLFTHVDEYCTSITCSNCFNRLTNVCKKGHGRGSAPVPGVLPWELQVHKLLQCKRIPRACKRIPRGKRIPRNPVLNQRVERARNYQRCGVTWDRDVNAARNMLMLLLLMIRGKPRPYEFERPGLRVPKDWWQRARRGS